MQLTVQPGGKLNGEISVEGDKSLSHRTIIIAALAQGTSVIHGFLAGKDCLATLEAMRQLGVAIERPQANTVLVHGKGRQALQAPKQPIDCGNSGTSMRLLAGVLAAQSFNSVLTGDSSLCQRPMDRIIEPLQRMGAQIQGNEVKQRIVPPLSIQGNDHLDAIEYTLPVASAQVKSCLLLAGLFTQRPTILIEKEPSRDHSERMLQAFGCRLSIDNLRITLTPGDELQAQEIHIPGDISSAAFFIAGASMVPGSHVIIRHVGVNPRRTGIIAILKQMGADITLHNERMMCGEPIADLEIKGKKLRGIDVPEQWIVSAIDEFPIIFVAASCAQGTTTIRGLEELRVKETDRIKAMATGLQALGVQLEELPDGIIITGKASFSGATVDSFGDHRIAMAFAIAALVSSQPIVICDCDNIATSFPSFSKLANQLGMSLVED